MGEDIFGLPGRFWRGNLHCHSTRSDGVLDPAEVCARYRDEGYDFIALTDHFVGLYDYPIVDTAAYRTSGFTTILGAELHSGAMENGSIWHILAVGLPEGFRPPDVPGFIAQPGQEPGVDLARRAREAGAFVAMAHPEWSGLSESDARAMAQAVHAVETYNHGCAVESDRGQGFYTLDRLLEAGHRLTLCATDDAHFKGPDHFGGWVMVKALENTPEALLAALKAGHYYASTGPEILDLDWKEDRVVVRCSPVSRVIVQGAREASVVVHGEGMTDVEVPIGHCAASPWMRVTIADQAGNRAWTNPKWKEAA